MHGPGHTGWKLGSEPQGHPLWEEQVELELRMVERGAERYRSRLAKARDKEEMTALRPYRRVLEDMVDAMGAGLHGWINGTHKAIAKRGGAEPIAYLMLKGLDPYLAAYVTARTVLDGLSGVGAKSDSLTQRGFLATARAVGQALEYEARMKAWTDAEPGLFASVQKKLKGQRATSKHKKRVNINTFNRLMAQPVRWRNWTGDEKVHTGVKLLDILARTTGHIQVIPDPAHVRRSVKTGKYVVVPSDELMQYLEESVLEDEGRMPQYLPCVMPPKRWEGVRKGGYYTPLVRLPRLIRFKADNEEVQGVASDEYDSLDMPKVFSALDAVQEVPWRVNQRVLAVVIEAWERDMAIGKLAKREPLDLPLSLPGQRRPDLKGDTRRTAEKAWAEENPVELKDWQRAAAKVYGENARRVSNAMASRTTIEIAEMFKDREFYFPHMLDFRGRMYPIPAYLQPQGNDLARGILTFAQGRPVGEAGTPWLGVHLANTWGNDKISFEDRTTWAYDNWDMWVRIAAAPLKNLEWAKVGNPWQTLAAIFEFVRVAGSANPAGEVSALPIRVDGTCNGIQHLSAMMRDEVGGASVNLVASQTPRDIYAESGVILKDRLEIIREGGGSPGAMADLWLGSFDGEVPRGFMKRPVMVTPYGGTKDSYKKYTLEWLAKEPNTIPEEDRWDATLWLVPHLWDAVAGRVVQARVCMEWLQKCAGLVADAGEPIWWTTKTGFHVRHFYGKLKKRIIRTEVDGKQVQLVDYQRTKTLSRKEQLQGIAPNFVHSQDAAVNMETILEFMGRTVAANGDVFCDDPEGQPPFTTIHDAFGTVAGEMWALFGCIRRAFVEIHKDDVLAKFRTRCVLMLRDHYMATHPEWNLEQSWVEADEKVPAVPGRGLLNLEEVHDADYFFA